MATNPNRARWALAAIAAAVIISGDARAIIRRHDREDAQYLELGAKYPSVVRLGGDSATLIDPRWLLTAAHVTSALSPFERAVRIGAKTYAIEAIIEHPQAREAVARERADIALVRLAAPVEGIAPIALYERSDEQGREIIVAGFGMFGDGLTGPQGGDGRLRAGVNLVAETMERFIAFPFDAPPAGAELEGISGPGDSGGPAFIEVEGVPQIAGVSSANRQGRASGTCRYESVEYYARVSTFKEWIATTMASPAPAAERALETIDLQASPWPDGRGAEVARAFFEAYGRGDAESFEAFERERRADAALVERPAAERAKAWRDRREAWGALRPLKCVQRGPILHVLAKTERGGWKALGFELEEGASGRLSGISVSDPVLGE